MIKRLITVSALIICTGLQFHYAQQRIELIDSYEVISKGIRLHDLQKYDAAIEEYKKVHRNDTNYYLALYELGYSYHENKQYEKARDIAMKGIKTESRYQHSFYILLGNTLDHLNKPEESLKIFDEGIEKYPNLYTLYFNKAATLYNMERYNDATVELKKALSLNPMHPRSHYLLASINASFGRTVPALMGFNMAAMLNNNGDFARMCIKGIEEVLFNKVKKTNESFIPAKDDNYDFSEVQMLIESNIALNNKYKVKAKMNNSVTRQNQLLFESLKYDPQSNDFYQKTYVHFFTEMNNAGYIVPYSYHILAYLDNDIVQNWLKKNQATVKKFTDWASAWLAKKMKEKDGKYYYYYEGNIPYCHGTYADKAEKIKSGEWTYYFSNGNMSSKGMFMNDKKDGDWLYFNEKGVLKRKDHWVNGVREGLQTEYHENGKISVEYNMKKDAFDGPYSLYYANGTLKETGQFTAGKKNGQARIYYFNGALKWDMNYLNDKLNGTCMSYYTNGKVKSKVEYSNGKLNGEFAEFYENGNLKTSATYKDDKRTGVFTSYYHNGKPKFVATYDDKGKITGTLKNYFFDGTLESEENYTDGKTNGECKYYDVDGKLYLCTKYVNDRLISITHYDKSGKVFSDVQVPKTKTEIKFYHPEGRLMAQGSYYDNMRQGKWKYYNRNGVLLSEINFKDNKKDGEMIYYHPNGKISEKYYMKDEEYDGYYISYHLNGKIKSEGWYVKGQRQQLWRDYYPNGKIESEYFYLNDELTGTQAEYHYNGSLHYETIYEDGVYNGEIIYDSVENVWARCMLSHGSGHFEQRTPDGKLLQYSDILNGENIDSLKSYYYANQQLKYACNFINGEREGVAYWYYPTGKLWSETPYVNGRMEGTKKSYNREGKIEYTQAYDYGEESGPFIRYYENGNKRLEMNYVNGSAEGNKIYYSPDGQEMYRVFFHDNENIYITWPEAGGKQSKPVMLTSDSVFIVTRYANGNKSAEFSMKGGVITGKYKEFYPNGKLRFESDYYYGDYVGVNKTYNAKEQLIKEEHYADDLRNGPSIQYYDNGKIKSHENYSGGDKHGVCLYYNENGKLIRMERYYFDELMEYKVYP